MNTKECRFCKNCDVNRTDNFGRVRCTRFSRYVGKFNCCDYFITEKLEKLFDVITEMDKFAEKRKPRKPRNFKNRKPYIKW